MARSMPWSNAINKRKCPSYKTEKIDVKSTKKKPVKKAKFCRNCSFISEPIVTK